jgi:lipoprotein-anchoring transpeptidase ErfK/SrfK
MLPSIEIDLASQCLRLSLGHRVLRQFSVSTARNGAGEREGSECTPRGRHHIAARIGSGMPVNTVFVGRRPTGEIWSREFAATQPTARDWILTRILWLAGNEPGFNQGGTLDTYSRYIYLHGTPDTVALGVPGSRGCVRMRNADIIELFDSVAVGCPVLIR